MDYHQNKTKINEYVSRGVFLMSAHSSTFFLLLKKKFFRNETNLTISRFTIEVVILHCLNFYYLTDILRKLKPADWSDIH